MNNHQTTALKTSSVLWVIWGLVHAFAGIMILTSDTTSGFQAIADGVEANLLVAQYHDAVGGILN